MHEIVTLQFGTQSNYLGSHFWNTQASTGLRSLSMPRLVIYPVSCLTLEGILLHLSTRGGVACQP